MRANKSVTQTGAVRQPTGFFLFERIVETLLMVIEDATEL
jgi:hypothetical protein